MTKTHLSCYCHKAWNREGSSMVLLSSEIPHRSNTLLELQIFCLLFYDAIFKIRRDEWWNISE